MRLLKPKPYETLIIPDVVPTSGEFIRVTRDFPDMHKLFENLDLILEFLHGTPTTDARKKWLSEHVPSLKEENVGDLSRIDTTPYRAFQGAGYVYPFFTAPKPGNRFNTMKFGALYLSRDQATCFAEVCYHYDQEMKDDFDPEREAIERILLKVDVNGLFHDIRGKQRRLPSVYNPNPGQYEKAQAFAQQLKDECDSKGLLYSSLRHRPGECLAAFTPEVINNCKVESTLWIYWDKQKKRSVVDCRKN